MPKLRVLHIIKSLDVGGIENQVLDFSRNAHRHDIDNHVISIGGGELEQQFSESPGHFRLLPKISFPNDVLDPLLVRHLRKYILTHQIDVIHSHFADEGIHSWLAAKGLKHVLLVQNFAVDRRINRRIDNIKFRFLSSRVDLNTTPTRTTAIQLIGFGRNTKRNVHWIHNGIDKRRILQESSSDLRKELNIPDHAVVGGMVGNFYNNVRDQLTVCKALPGLMQRFPRFHFVFAGGYLNQWIRNNTSYFDRCMEVCRENDLLERVHFPGLIKDVSKVLSALDLYVHSTNFDTFGIAPVEAMFHKLPVVANDHPVFREVSNEGQGMVLFKSKDAGDLCRKIAGLIENENLRRQMGAAHFQHADFYYTIDVHIKNMKALYLRSLEDKWKHRTIQSK